MNIDSSELSVIPTCIGELSVIPILISIVEVIIVSLPHIPLKTNTWMCYTNNNLLATSSHRGRLRVGIRAHTPNAVRSRLKAMVMDTTIS